jgi:hypothetical protein
MTRTDDYLRRVSGMPDVGQGSGWSIRHWRRCPVERVPLSELVATQSYLSEACLSRGPSMFGLKPCVVVWRGYRYIADGHHRVVRVIRRGEPHLQAHVMRIEPGG